jgi:hemoglobin-like flavoprotein
VAADGGDRVVTPEQVAIVRRNAVAIEQDGDRFARTFYDHLFAHHPSARCLFPEDLDLQRSRLLTEIMRLVAAVGHLPSFLERARELGRRHQGYGVRADDYPFVGEALVAAVATVAGDQWDAEADAAWRRTYLLISEAMLEGARSGLFTTDPAGAPGGPPPSAGAV